MVIFDQNTKKLYNYRIRFRLLKKETREILYLWLTIKTGSIIFLKLYTLEHVFHNYLIRNKK